MTLDNFQWDGSAWTGSIAVSGGMLIEVEINPDLDAPQIPALAQTVIDRLQADEARYRFAAAEHLTPIYNARWSQFETLSPEAFAGRIVLDAAVIYGEESAELFYEDGDLFQGHAILLTLNGAAEIESVQLAG